MPDLGTRQFAGLLRHTLRNFFGVQEIPIAQDAKSGW
jgi:hypothetical protein